MKLVFCMLFVLAIAMVVGCGSGSSEIEQNGVSKPAQSTKSEPSPKEATLLGTSKITPTQVQIRLPRTLSQSSDDIKNLQSKISDLERRVSAIEDTLKGGLFGSGSAIRDLEKDVAGLQDTLRGSLFGSGSAIRDLERDVSDLQRKIR